MKTVSITATICANVSLPKVQGILLSLIFALFLSSEVSGQDHSLRVENPQDIFSKIETCQGYLSYIAEEPVIEYDDCHPISRFLIESAELDRKAFLTSIQSLASPKTTLGSFAELLHLVVNGDIAGTYNVAGVSGGRAAIKLASSLDVQRAALYSHLTYEIQLRALVALCGLERCQGLRHLSTIDEKFGESFGYLDELSPDIVLFCLLRTEGYTVPLPKVLSSARFDSCLNTEASLK